jgi:hypothetical protein
LNPGVSQPRARGGRRRWPRRIAFFLVAATILWLTSAYAVAYLLTRRLGSSYAEPPPSAGRPWSLSDQTSDGEELGAWFLDGSERDPLVLILPRRWGRGACLGQAKIAARIGARSS